jgi:hypothetical protein
MTRKTWMALVVVVLAPACAQQPRQAPQTQAGPERVTVTATEYAFDIPQTLPPGETTFVLENAGQERHFMEMVRLKGGKSVEELLELPGNRADRFIEEVGGTRPAKPGGSVEMTAELAPGAYGIVCFIEAPDGTPHAFKGMYAQFTVA